MYQREAMTLTTNTNTMNNATNIIDTLPAKSEVAAAFGSSALRITKRNNQYIVTVAFSDHMSLRVLANSFGQFKSIARQPIVTLKIK